MDELFAPVICYESLRLLLAISAHYGWIPQQLDIKSAFLHGDLKELIYMKLPEGYRKADMVCKLNKCLYGLKQSPREWYAKLTASLLSKGFRPTQFDPCVFIYKTEQIDDPSYYQCIIGSLMYAVTGSQPDLAYIVTFLSQFNSCPSKSHLQAAK